MKLHIKLALVSAIALLMGGCSKIDWNDFFHDRDHKQLCDLASYRVMKYPELDYPLLFAKKYDASGKVVVEIQAAFLNVRPPEYLYHYRLRVVYKPGKIYFINMGTPFDTLVTAILDKRNRVLETWSRNKYHPEILEMSRYSYRDGRLFSILTSNGLGGRIDTCRYDAQGNITSISVFQSGWDVGVFFEYDHSKTAKQQFYNEDPQNINNDFTLMQYMGFFPELNPVNLRTRTWIGQQGGFGWDNVFGNHKLDGRGRLIQYEILNNNTPVYLEWNCRAQN